jgi:DNA-binding LytR/AlgR family response regulator
LRILICDDDARETETLAGLLSELDNKPVVFNAGAEALEYFCSGGLVDLCFLDILMPEMSGIDLAEKLRENGFAGDIVFLSSSKDFGPETYAVKAFNYLLKPPTKDNVEKIISDAQAVREKADNQGITVNTKSMTRFIKYSELSHVEVMKNCVYFRLTNGEEIELYSTLDKIASQLLQDSRFVQSHRSYIVNMDDITNITGVRITLRKGKVIPITRSYSDTRNTYFKWKFGGERT